MDSKQTVYALDIGSQSTVINKLLRAADLADGAIILDGTTLKVTVSWKAGETVTRKREEALMSVIKETFEQAGYVVPYITVHTHWS